ncbi:MAG: drug/metabolite exporter YedA [Acidobacteriota bacterium]
MRTRNGLLPLIAAFSAVYVIWGSTYLAIRYAIETIPPFLMAAGRFLAAGTAVYLWARWWGAPKPDRAGWTGAALVGGLLLLGGNGGVVWSEQHVPSGLAALLVSTVPLWMVLLDWTRRDGSRPQGQTLVGIAAGFAGVGLLVEPSAGISAGRVPWFPALVLIGASVSWSLGSILSRAAALPRSPVLAGGMQMVSGGTLLLGASWLRGEWGMFHPEQVSLRSVAGWAYLVVFGSVVGFIAYVWLLREVSPASVSTYAFVNPAVAVFLGWALADEPLTPRVLLSMALIIAAVVLVTLRRRPAPKPIVRPPVPPAARVCTGPPGD